MVQVINQKVESTNNGTTDKSATETDNATPAESARNNNSTTATNENAPTGSTATVPTTNASTGAASSADSKDNASVNDSKQNAEVNIVVNLNQLMARLHNQNLKIKLRMKKMVEIQQIKVWLNQQLKHCLQQTLQNQKYLLIQRKIKKKVRQIKQMLEQLKSETNVASNEADKI